MLRHDADAQVIVREDCADAVAGALFHGEGCSPLNTEGRGEVYQFGLPESVYEVEQQEASGVLRRLRRGGLAALVMEDGYLGNRPLREFMVHHAIHTAGVPCVEPLGVLWRKRGIFFSGALATRYIEGESLFGVLLRGGKHTSALHAAGRAIRALHEAGALHRDLHPANILVAHGVAYLLDFDGARMLAVTSPSQRASNLLRLRRAFVKHGERAAFDVLLEGYGAPLDAANWQHALAAIHEVKVRILADR